MNCGSVDSLKVWTRCGLRPKARQMRETADCDMPADLAIDRVDQCVSPFGGSCSRVVAMTFSTCSSVTVRGRPGRGSSLRPSSRDSRNRDRHLPAVALDIPRSAATALTAAAVRAGQHDPRPQRQRLGGLPAPRPSLQDLPLVIGQHEQAQASDSP